ncbi:hypothetical protein ACHQM5_021369 [Ranunculus cassubicifolius]
MVWMVMLLAFIASYTPFVESAISCEQVEAYIRPCYCYLQYGGDMSPRCCRGLSYVNSTIENEDDRRALCECLKKLAGTIPELNPKYAEYLPAKCGVKFPFSISTSANCPRVQ